MALSGSAPRPAPPGSPPRAAEEASNPSASPEACTDDANLVELARAEALAAELFPDEDDDGAPALPLKKPPAAVDTGPTPGQLPPPPGLPPPGLEGVLACGGPQGAQEDIKLLELMDGMKTAEAMLDAVSEHLPRLTTEMTAEALHRVACRLPSAIPLARSLTLNPGLRPLLLKLSRGISKLQCARPLAQLAWTLGKLDMRAHPQSPPPLPGMKECMLHICGLLPKMMAKCPLQDLTNTLWGIARLFPGGASGAQGHVQQVSFVSHAIVRQCIQMVPCLTSKSVANSFWAIARLKVHGPDVEQYMRLALDQTNTLAQLSCFTPQGLANLLWALAQLRVAGVGKGPQDNSFQLTLIAMAEASAGRLLEFQTQELSMVAWSFAKLYEFKKGETGPVRKGRASSRPASVDDMLLKLAAVATDRIDKFEDQGISNIAWALATLELTGTAPQGFIQAAMAHCATELGGYSAQAVANLMWACVRMDCSRRGSRNRSTMERFCSAVAEEMMLRMTIPPNSLRRDRHGSDTTVTWRDVAGVAVALAHWGQKSQSVMAFMTLLSWQAVKWVANGFLTSQQMLNIAQSAARLHVPPEDMQELVDTIGACIVTRSLWLNDVDKRQWAEVQQWCPPRGPVSGDANDEGTRYDIRGQCAAQHRCENTPSKWSPLEHYAAPWAHGGGYSTWYATQPLVPGSWLCGSSNWEGGCSLPAQATFYMDYEGVRRRCEQAARIVRPRGSSS